jgi:hypothetical protein
LAAREANCSTKTVACFDWELSAIIAPDVPSAITAPDEPPAITAAGDLPAITAPGWTGSPDGTPAAGVAVAFPITFSRN